VIDLPTEGFITCDSCDASQEIDLTEYSGDPSTVGVDSSTIADIGWLEVDGEHFCTECRKEHE
jgi:hypothetical protein